MPAFDLELVLAERLDRRDHRRGEGHVGAVVAGRIVVGLSETIRIMAEIDEVIEEHGGWPDAFVTQSDDAE